MGIYKYAFTDKKKAPRPGDDRKVEWHTLEARRDSFAIEKAQKTCLEEGWELAAVYRTNDDGTEEVIHEQ